MMLGSLVFFSSLIKFSIFISPSTIFILEHIKEFDHIFISLFSKLKKGGKCFICEIHPKKQLNGSKVRFKINKKETTLDTFLHSVKVYIQNAEMAGFRLLDKSDWYDKINQIPRLLSLLFEKPT